MIPLNNETMCAAVLRFWIMSRLNKTLDETYNVESYEEASPVPDDSCIYGIEVRLKGTKSKYIITVTEVTE
jgi:hypothetical protein